jgi:hypothetical protein
MVASKASRPKGSVADAHSAPNSTALMTLPLRSAAAAMSKRMKRCAASRQAASSAALSDTPSPSADFSAMA